MENHNIKKEYSPDEMVEIFTAKAVKIVACFLVVTGIIYAAVYFIISSNILLFSGDKNQTENSEITFSYMTDGAVESGNIKFTADSCTIKGDTVYLKISGENLGESIWEADGKTFAISYFNTNAAETRYHYYSDEWTKFEVAPVESFECEIEYTIKGAEEKKENGYTFSMSAFRGDDMPSVEIVLNDIKIER